MVAGGSEGVTAEGRREGLFDRMANMLGVVVPHLRDSCARELVFCLFKDAYWAVVHSTCILQAALELLPDNGNITALVAPPCICRWLP